MSALALTRLRELDSNRAKALVEGVGKSRSMGGTVRRRFAEIDVQDQPSPTICSLTVHKWLRNARSRARAAGSMICWC